MANQNLSQFTEKLFVADADHTFIWDTAASISKRVSRNSWLNSGTLTSDAPVTISQTWNNAAVAFTGLKVNAAGTSGTNSAAASLLLDLQVGGVSQASVNKSGNLTVVGNLAANGGNSFLSGTTLRIGNSNGDINLSGGSLIVPLTTAFGWANTLLVRDGADNTLALRNGANGQTFSVYGTYPGAAWERFTITAPTSGNVLLGTYKGTGGIARGLEFQTDGVTRMTISGGGGDTVLVSSFSAAGIINTGNRTLWSGKSALSSPADGLLLVTNNGATDFNRIQLGGTADTFPAIKRSTTRIQAVLATTDTTFTNIQGKLTTDTAFTATTVTPTGFITLYDSTGTAYKVPCVPA